MRNLLVRPVTKHIAEPVRAEAHPGVHPHATAKLSPGVAGHALVQLAVVPYLNARPDDDVRTKAHARPDARTVTNNDKRPDGDVVPEHRPAANHDGRMNAGYARRRRIQHRQQGQHGVVRVVDDHARARTSGRVGERG